MLIKNFLKSLDNSCRGFWRKNAYYDQKNQISLELFYMLKSRKLYLYTSYLKKNIDIKVDIKNSIPTKLLYQAVTTM